jgi:hypothetical protein
MSPRAPKHQVRHPPEKGSGVATWPKAQSLSLGRKGLRSRHAPHGSRPAPCAGRLRHHNVTEAPGLPPGRAPISPRVQWLQTCLLVREGTGDATCPVALSPRVCLCVPKMPNIRLIMASSRTWCRQRIKCVCDMYGADLLDRRNEQAIMRGDLTPQRSKAAIVQVTCQLTLYRA